MAYASPGFAPHFLATRSDSDIANRLREDEALIDAGNPCSWVAWDLPAYSTEQGKGIAAHLTTIPDLSHDLKRVIYENLVDKIRRYLNGAGGVGISSEGVQELDSKQELVQEQLRPWEISTAFKVLANMQEKAIIQSDTPAGAVISWLEKELVASRPERNHSNEVAASIIPKPPDIPRKRLCYICRLVITESYHSHPSMCIPCGAFNSASSLISTSPTLRLSSNFIALVTGARLNLGYHTTLRLLRCGARVIATTRYPRDAVTRYMNEEDAGAWKGRLKVIGADFRSAADAFALAKETKRCLEDWNAGRDAKLTAIINNAAQTLTDGIKKEERAIAREDTLQHVIRGRQLLIEGAYKARVRGGALPMLLDSTKDGVKTLQDGSEGGHSRVNKSDAHAANDASTMEIEPYSKSSWVQSLFDIPYEDIMSAHAVNTFVPLILIRELLPIMGSNKLASSLSNNTEPQGYIVNVSSREGIFEDRTKANAKGGKHVHTNMSKAALNMITETEAGDAWKSRRIAMNTVDPGYMSAAPEYENAFDGMRPIGWEDGAGRVLWPIAVGELEGKGIWGRFLKHYGAVEVDPSAGRG